MIVGVASRQELAPDSFHEVFANATHPDRLVRFKGKVVIVGYTSADDRWDVSAGQGGARYGVELQASAVSNLLGGIAIKPLRPSVQYLIILIMGAVGALIRHVLRGGRRLSIPVRIRSVASTTRARSNPPDRRDRRVHTGRFSGV